MVSIRWRSLLFRCLLRMVMVEVRLVVGVLGAIGEDNGLLIKVVLGIGDGDRVD